MKKTTSAWLVVLPDDFYCNSTNIPGQFILAIFMDGSDVQNKFQRTSQYLSRLDIEKGNL